jgi:hypothetical protein
MGPGEQGAAGQQQNADDFRFHDDFSYRVKRIGTANGCGLHDSLIRPGDGG